MSDELPIHEWIALQRKMISAKPPAHTDAVGTKATFCAHPGCKHFVYPSSNTGVCRDHMHKTACRCKRCREKH